MADGLEPLPDMAALWLALACGVGLVRSEAGGDGDRVVAAGPEFWVEHADPPAADDRHPLARLAAVAGRGQSRGREPRRPAASDLPPARRAALAGVPAGRRVGGAGRPGPAPLRTIHPEWDRPSLRPARRPRPERDAGVAARASRGNALLAAPHAWRAAASPAAAGSGYAMGLVRAGEEKDSGRTVVQLTPWAATSWPWALRRRPRPTFEHFLFVQPNFEIIAYRQGLNPQLVGRLSRFAWWTKIGAALELKLTQESIVLGLEGGIPPSRCSRSWRSTAAPAAHARARRHRPLVQPPRADHLLRRRNPDRVPLLH